MPTRRPCRRCCKETLKSADDGELFLEHAQAESLSFDNGRLKGGSFNTDQGFGLRAVAGEAVGLCAFGRDDAVGAEARGGCCGCAVTRGYSG
jgi:TldD protein